MPEEPMPPMGDASRKDSIPRKDATARNHASGPKDLNRARSSRRRRRAVVSVLTGVGIAAVAAGVIAAGSVLPSRPVSRTVDPVPVALPAGQSVGICPGPVRLLAGPGIGTDPQFSAASSSSKTTVRALLLSSERGILPGGVLTRLGPGSPLATLAPASSAAEAAAAATTPSAQPGANAPDNRKAAVLPPQSVGAPSVLRTDPLNGQRSSANGVLTYTAADGDLAGLAAANCQGPSNESWLMGASTTVGRTAVLNIVNASATAATVNLELYGDQGVLEAPGAKGLLVPAGTSRSIVLSGLAAGQKNLAVRLKSSGGPVAATISQSVLRGLTPGGVDILGPAAAPAVRQVITGVEVQDPQLAAALAALPGYADATSALQVVVPGGTDALVQVKVYGTSGQGLLPNGGVFTAKAGSVSELPLTGLPAGTYTVEVRSDSAFAATARVIRGTKAGQRLDFGFSAATAPLVSGHLITLPQDVSSRLSFGVPDGRAKVSLIPVTTAGKLLPVKTIDVAGATTVLVDPLQLGGSTVAGFIASATGDPVYGAQLLTGKDAAGKDAAAVSVLAVPQGVTGAQSVQVILGY